jgi:hypothetical protein
VSNFEQTAAAKERKRVLDVRARGRAHLERAHSGKDQFLQSIKEVTLAAYCSKGQDQCLVSYIIDFDFNLTWLFRPQTFFLSGCPGNEVGIWERTT